MNVEKEVIELPKKSKSYLALDDLSKKLTTIRETTENYVAKKDENIGNKEEIIPVKSIVDKKEDNNNAKETVSAKIFVDKKIENINNKEKIIPVKSNVDKKEDNNNAKETVSAKSFVDKKTESVNNKEEIIPIKSIVDKKEENNNAKETISAKSFVDKKIESINNKENVFGIGKVIKVNDYILIANGLENVTYFEKVKIANKAIGYVTKINANNVIIALLEEKEKVNVGDVIYQTNQSLKGLFSIKSLGHIIDLFGNDKLVNKKFEDLIELDIEQKNIPIMDRTSVKRPLLTGIVGIDMMYPIGKGQREVVIGDRKTGKTQICLDTILNQKDRNVYCIYVAIGKTKKEVKEIYYELLKRGAMNYTIIITAFNDEKPSLLTLTPFYALSVAQYMMFHKKDVLVVIDDLKRHAEAYREVSLLSNKAPGREAYPADIFYLHSRLLEKGCQYKNGGSITIMPITTTKSGDITDYITTNIISITDGQIVLSAKNFNQGRKPAINYKLSVSRLGGQVQNDEIKVLGNKIRNLLLSYLESKEIYELANTDELPIELQNKLNNGKKMLNDLIQYKFTLVDEKSIVEKFSKYLENKNV